MRTLVLRLIAIIVLATAAVPAWALSCVPYARSASGINLQGDAWEWWHAAAGVYQRGNMPQGGAVLVFARQGTMVRGHVSVVAQVVSPRMVLVDHANWSPAGAGDRGRVEQAVPVLDVSTANDWSAVRVWYTPANDFGNRVYSTQGFVYSGEAAAPVLAASRPVRPEHTLSVPGTADLVKVGSHSFHPRRMIQMAAARQ
ncbi:MAG: CHAP domain-containing protein [Magnetospirillum sp.]|nr:CHAP domain-containing protein [Magnetospirillum sp.]